MLRAATEPSARLEATCPACSCCEVVDILTIDDAPVMVATVFADAQAAIATPGGTIHLVCCPRCGLLFNRTFDPELALAGARYESSQACSNHFDTYIQSLAEEWVTRHSLRGKRVIEVGCGQAHFLLSLLRAGAGAAHGIDPLALMPEEAGHLAERISFDFSDLSGAHLDIPGDALVCRHTIEHVPDIAGFLGLVSEWSRRNGDAPVLFEAPAAERIVRDGAFWDLYYEHCNYFSRHSLEIAFRKAGLRIDRSQIAYDGQYLLMEARHEPSADAAVLPEPDWIQTCRRFGKRADHAVRSCRARMLNYGATPGGLVIWQGAAKTVGLLTSLGSGVPIRFAVDLNARRHGFHLPPSGLQVRAPSAIAEASPDHVVLMNPVYFNEVSAQLRAMGCADTRLHTIDSLIAGEAPQPSGVAHGAVPS